MVPSASDVVTFIGTPEIESSFTPIGSTESNVKMLQYAIGEFVTDVATVTRITLPISTAGRFTTSLFDAG